MATKDAIAQSVMTYDALYERAVLLDQFKEGLKEIGAFQLIAAFRVEMARFFTFQGKLTPDEVCNALRVDRELTPDNQLVVTYLHRYINTLTEEGKECKDY